MTINSNRKTEEEAVWTTSQTFHLTLPTAPKDTIIRSFSLTRFLLLLSSLVFVCAKAQRENNGYEPIKGCVVESEFGGGGSLHSRIHSGSPSLLAFRWRFGCSEPLFSFCLCPLRLWLLFSTHSFHSSRSFSVLFQIWFP